jgi:hypothetical protein
MENNLQMKISLYGTRIKKEVERTNDGRSLFEVLYGSCLHIQKVI